MGLPTGLLKILLTGFIGVFLEVFLRVLGLPGANLPRGLPQVLHGVSGDLPV